MSGEMVSWKDYEGVEFGASTQQEVDNLNKALTAGADIAAPGAVVAGDGFALRVESLESTLKVVTYKMDHLKLWKAIPKLPAYNTVEEFNQLQNYGSNDDSAFIAEGNLPESDDSSYQRKYSVVKFLGTTRSVTHPMTLVSSAHGPVIAQETINGTMHLLKQLERALFYGDSSCISVQFDGYEKLITDNSPATNIVDLRGLPLSEDILTDVALTLQDSPNYGTPTNLHLNPKVKADLVKTFFPKERHDTFASNKNGMIGTDIRGWTSPAGDVQFDSNVFITDGGGPNAAAIGDATKRPGTPTISTAVATPTDATALFTADDVGDYFYSVVAVNRYGRSAAVACDAGAVSMIVGDKMTVGVTPGGATAVEYYALYRSAKNGAVGNQRLISRTPNAAGSGATLLADLNFNLPFCTSAFLFQQNLECMSFKQLAPLLKIPLATIDSSIRWMQLIYGVPVLYTPGKALLIKNIGRASGYVGAP